MHGTLLLFFVKQISIVSCSGAHVHTVAFVPSLHRTAPVANVLGQVVFVDGGKQALAIVLIPAFPRVLRVSLALQS